MVLSFFAIDHNRKRKWIILDSFQKSEKLFLNILENLQSPFFLTDFSLSVLFMNRDGAKFFLETEKHNEKQPNFHEIIKNILNKDDLLMFNSMVETCINEKKVASKLFWKCKRNIREVCEQSLFSLTISKVSIIYK